MSFSALIAVPGFPPWAADPLRRCAGKPLRMFFPERGDDTTEARQLCRGCPFKGPCGDYALDHRESGIWAGLDDRERYAILRRRSAVRARRPNVRVRREAARSLAGQGLSRRDVAEQMGISFRQVERHLSNGSGVAMSPVDVRARDEAVAALVGQGLGTAAVMHELRTSRSTAQRLIRRASDRMQVAA